MFGIETQGGEHHGHKTDQPLNITLLEKIGGVGGVDKEQATSLAFTTIPGTAPPNTPQDSPGQTTSQPFQAPPHRLTRPRTDPGPAAEHRIPVVLSETLK